MNSIDEDLSMLADADNRMRKEKQENTVRAEHFFFEAQTGRIILDVGLPMPPSNYYRFMLPLSMFDRVKRWAEEAKISSCGTLEWSSEQVDTLTDEDRKMRRTHREQAAVDYRKADARFRAPALDSFDFDAEQIRSFVRDVIANTVTLGYWSLLNPTIQHAIIYSGAISAILTAQTPNGFTREAVRELVKAMCVEAGLEPEGHWLKMEVDG